VLLTAAVVVPLAGAASAPVNLVGNSGAEAGLAASDSSVVVRSIPGWHRTGKFDVVRYGTSGFPTVSFGQGIHGGKNFFTGGPSDATVDPVSAVTQTVSVARSAVAIDAGTMRATLAGYLGGYSTQKDAATATATFLDGGGQKLKSIRIGPVTAAQRQNVTTLLARTAKAPVPAKTRSIELTIRAIRAEGGGYNDGYADNVALTLVPLAKG
jgi:hypothetical protein